MALANMFRKHIGQFDIMQECGSTLTLQVYQQSNMIILMDENEKLKTVYDIFTYKYHLNKWIDNYSWCDINYWIEIRLWKKPTPDQWLLIKDLAKRGVNVKFVAKPGKEGKKKDD